MAYQYTQIQLADNSKPLNVFCGEAEDVCFECNHSLAGKDCVRIESDNILVCLDGRGCLARASGLEESDYDEQLVEDGVRI